MLLSLGARLSSSQVSDVKVGALASILTLVLRLLATLLVLQIVPLQGVERGALVRVRLGQVDTMALDVKATFVCLLETASPPSDDNTEEETAVGPIAIALDMDDTANDTGGETTAPSPAL